MPTARIQTLRDRALARKVTGPFQRPILEAQSWRETVAEPWLIVRKAKRITHVLGALPIDIAEDELLVGRAKTLREPNEKEKKALEEARAFWTLQPKHLGQTGHMAVDYEKLLRLGARGIQAEIRRHMAALGTSDPEQHRKERFYAATLIALDGLIRLGERFSVLAAQQAAKTKDRALRKGLLEISHVCARVPAGPARTFREALQSVHLLIFALTYAEPHYLFCPGRVDRWLYPFYRRDLAAGRADAKHPTTPAQAQELLDCFYILINEITGPSVAIGLMIGGQDADGKDVTNEVSYMCLQAIEDVALSYPSVGICWHKGTPGRLMQRGVEIMSRGKANPAVFNDDVIIKGLKGAGMPHEEAVNYINSTCVEISPIASSNIWVASPYYNLPGKLLEVLREMAAGKRPMAKDMKGLMRAYKQALGGAIAAAVRVENSNRETRLRFGGCPLLSCFVTDCLARGLDIDYGGARYNWIECSFVGLANLADSLAVIREFVFEERELTIPRLVRLLDSNFKDAEVTRLRFLNTVPKYGNDEDSVDALAVQIVSFLTAECRKHKVTLGGGYHPGFFCWIMHERLGRDTGATPDGRLAGLALADGAGPAQGRERFGPTAAVKSITKWNHVPMLGGLVLNLKFSRNAVANAESRDKLTQLIRTYMRLGGFEIQVNVVDRSTLEAAMKHPESYRDLLVRIAGYSDYFTRLDTRMQREIISRTEFSLITGH